MRTFSQVLVELQQSQWMPPSDGSAEDPRLCSRASLLELPLSPRALLEQCLCLLLPHLLAFRKAMIFKPVVLLHRAILITD